MTIVPVTSADLDALEISWFSALCSDDYAYLGVPDGALRSSFDHCRDITLEAEAQGFRNILAPSSYQVGQDTLSFVAAMAPLTSRINFLAAIRCGEMQPIMLARTIATLEPGEWPAQVEIGSETTTGQRRGRRGGADPASDRNRDHQHRHDAHDLGRGRPRHVTGGAVVDAHGALPR